MSTILNKKAKPFLKWAGGKTQLLETFELYYPKAIYEGKVKRYIEPFVGSGAVLFEIGQTFDFEDIYIWDINPELILVYEVIKNNVDDLIEKLKEKEDQYLALESEGRKAYYYKIRDEFNNALNGFDFYRYHKGKIERASQMIFLNRTCFNGLFRVNKSGYFNVPMGDYKKPTICDEENLRAVSQFLQRVNINLGDYKESRDYVNDETFVYFDPPYRPLNQTSNFTSYSKYDFTDENQKELARYFAELDAKGAFLMLSNSDPKNTNEQDHFFDELYAPFNIYRISAKRMINSKASKRGAINEILVTNYKD
ncbi:DNA adenine methylase [Parageobacillus thermoglucosidasius]|uniref:Site-specific DNA-methyltransferase (adenine-specific) n=1 Tax=Parageobacillus thermoglucosidasius TaxID=1426 RepID=A0AAN1D6N3_PARTM|nr:DNA adenine methylase [Parageobacillus thermoglucosidasius]KYD14712.1 Methyl-directed repair DNA adenine methylase [Anoxybacillus flavithermus]REK55120.1 MAG: DNA adenine methylase [Geobacillus sp.]ALF10231.1 modification methylase [Parageobacillus thermoglucosidasius]ANZ30313.1 modification methylase [Parageobacillus thermoglucosidasius]APM81051.1 modification methylase [Parageobacillus thermoglucosidasius]